MIINPYFVRSPAVFAFDNFTRANETPLASPYDSGMGSSNQVNLVSNTAQGTSGTNEARITTPVFTGNHWAEVTAALGSIAGWGPAVRLQPLVSDCYFIFLQSSTNLQLWKSASDGGAFSQLGADVPIAAVAAGTKVRLSVSGSSTASLEAFINGSSVATRSDASSPIVGGQPGFLINGTQFIGGFQASDI